MQIAGGAAQMGLSAASAAQTIKGAQIDAVAPPGEVLPDPATRKIAPTIVRGVDDSMRLADEESFGPVVGIMPVHSDAEAIALMNDSPFGLTASVWTKDLAAGEAIGQQTQTGTFFMNRCDYLDPGLAWTGIGDTGRGASLSQIGYEQLTRPMSFHLKHEQ